MTCYGYSWRLEHVKTKLKPYDDHQVSMIFNGLFHDFRERVKLRVANFKIAVVVTCCGLQEEMDSNLWLRRLEAKFLRGKRGKFRIISAHSMMGVLWASNVGNR